MNHHFLTQRNGGAPPCTIQRLKTTCGEALQTLSSNSTCAATTWAPRWAAWWGTRCFDTTCLGRRWRVSTAWSRRATPGG